MKNKKKGNSRGNEALAGYRLLDLGAGHAASVAGLMLAESGCEVVKIRLKNRPSHLTPLQREMWDRSKNEIELDLSSSGGKDERFQDLLQSADGLIHDFTPSEAARLGLEDDKLLNENPNLVISSITGWPAGHSKQDCPVSDPIVLAESGFFDEQAAVGRSGPIYLRFPLGSWHAAFLCTAGFLARIYAREVSTCGGGSVRTSLLQGALIPQMMIWYRAENDGPGMAGWPKNHPTSLFECSDGRWLHLMGQPANAPWIKHVIDNMPAEERDRLNQPYKEIENPFINEWGVVKEVIKTRSSGDWLQHFWEVGIPAQASMHMGELYFDEQAKANNYVVGVESERLGYTLQPGVPFHMEEGAKFSGKCTKRRHRETSRDFDMGISGKGPLSGIRVLDLGNFLAGPLTTMLLSELGADVIKLEAPSGDPMRPIAWAFNGCQRGKRGIALSLKEPAARPIFERLVRDVDIVHHNIRLPSAKKLGIDYEVLRALNPEIIYSHVSSYGRFGPRRDWPGYDQLFQAASGWELDGAGEGNPPMWHRFGMMDHLGALSSLVTTLIALVNKARSGRGQFVASSLLGASMFTTETLVTSDGGLASYPRLDSDQLGVSPLRRLYQCNDGWIVLHETVERGSKDILKSAGVESFEALESLFAKINTAKAIEIARESCVEGARVNFDQRDSFLDGDSNRKSGLVASMEHPIYGRFEQPGRFWHFEHTNTGEMNPLPPPLCGQHSREILIELGYSPSQVAQFFEERVVS